MSDAQELNYKVITIVAGLMKSKLTESQHIDICKPINLLNKEWGEKNPPKTTHLNKQKLKKQKLEIP